MKNPMLSVIVLSYNTQGLLRACLKSLQLVRKEIDFEVIVSDNASSDGSVEMVKNEFKWVNIIENSSNLGFAAGNNRAREYCKGKYILFLNSDTVVYQGTLKETITFLEENKKVGALTCKLVLPNGKLDQDVRRSFITPWIGLVHIFLKLDKLFPKSKLFGQYWYGYIPEDQTHEVDVIQGAYFLSTKKVLDTVGWFDEDYFLDGEDIDLCWRIKEKGWKIIYYPKVSILHVKGASKGKNKKNKSIPFAEKVKFRMAGVNSMEMFLRKRLWKKYPIWLVLIMLLGMKTLKLVRFLKLLIVGY